MEAIEKNLNQGVETKYILEAKVGDIFYWTDDFEADVKRFKEKAMMCVKEFDQLAKQINYILQDK